MPRKAKPKSNKMQKAIISELEVMRMKNIEDNKAVLAKIMEDLEKSGMFAKPKPKPRAVQVKRSSVGDNEEGRRLSLRPRVIGQVTEVRMTRQRHKQLEESGKASGESSEPSSPSSHLVVCFPGFGGKKRSYSDEEDENDENNNRIPRAKRQKIIDREILSPDEITQVELDAVVDSVKDKVYDQVHGTTCHQCRQKTDDMKTICRSGECFGVRGQFCGVCLRNRYGEDAREALKDPDWMCPPCRGICNCSICRRRLGISATGILVHVAHSMGYTNVNDYLQSLRK